MNNKFLEHLNQQLQEIESSGMSKAERVLTSPQSSHITLENGSEVINLCANNYLGLADNKELIAAAKEHLDQGGFGMASVRFICGTNIIHHQLEATISQFLGTEATLAYPSCFDANAGLFEAILTAEDAIISDQLNHASIIDGVRLCKAARYRYQNNDMADLEAKLKQADSDGVRFKLIATDGVFSMDGIIANLKGITDLAERYNAIVMVDDSHATGFIGNKGQGTPDLCGVDDKVDIITSTLGKALGGASGGFTSGRKEIIDMLRQRSRPYLFSNALAPVIAATSIKVFELLERGDDLRTKLQQNQSYFRQQMASAGFDLIPGEHPIIPVMLYDERIASTMAEQLLQEGIYVIAFSYPVVPKGKARIRTQISAGHSRQQLDQAVAAFTKIGKRMAII